jgi:hypothetical protein
LLTTRRGGEIHEEVGFRSASVATHLKRNRSRSVIPD